jgi:murein DD-endopeptidase MepM/ murein hydrolase activator NlpD
MQVLITHTTLARAKVLQFTRLQLMGVAAALALLMMLASGAVYHFIFLQAAREGWPVVSQIVRWVVRDEVEQRERFMRENLSAMAQRLGEVQAKLIKLEAMGERVSGLAGVPASELAPLRQTKGGGQGGAYVPAGTPSMEQLTQAIERVDLTASQHTDLFTLIESRLLESRLQALMVPSSAPVDGPVGSRFGFRSDPFTGHTALHTGLDFPAEVGTPIRAATGGVVTATDWHAEYGHLLVLDHGNGLTTRYAHASRILVKPGDLVRRGQTVAEVGSSGRSTGPHLHFEVLVDGVPQNPSRFLASADGTTPAKAGRR